ncbi:MAG: UDP-3-O-acyl-N-acetylglucosamine deacetylase [Myxococcales bacterium]|nr:UDP-3-O-acyl-N-acetylglucosamine deacetylase [Myxococcales bacterium]
MDTAAECRGVGLFTGATRTVRLLCRVGPLAVSVAGTEVALQELVVGAQGRTSVLRRCGDDAPFVSCVEHLFAALGALGIRDGLLVDVDGDELPLLDGGALAWGRALLALALPASPPKLRVVRDGVVSVGRATYEWRRASSDESACEVHLDAFHPRVERVARWDGTRRDFLERIAPARTFVMAREIGWMLAQGLTAKVDPESVVVLGDDEIFAAGRPFSADEPARHKLLDLIGDLALHGGPPLGRVVALSPGHALTHEAVRRALAEGVVARG